jgi:hypothetical protein
MKKFLSHPHKIYLDPNFIGIQNLLWVSFYGFCVYEQKINENIY